MGIKNGVPPDKIEKFMKKLYRQKTFVTQTSGFCEDCRFPVQPAFLFPAYSLEKAVLLSVAE